MSKKINILLIEDEEGIGIILKDILEENNYDVTWIKDGKEGLDKAFEDSFDLIMLDINLPGMNGFEVCRRIKSHPLGDLTPIIILTVRKALPDKLKGLGLGADDYITKPFEIEEVLERVKTVLKRKQRYLEKHPVTMLPSYFNLFEEYEKYRGKGFFLVYGKLSDIMNYAIVYGYNKATELVKSVAEFLKKEVDILFHIDGIQFFMIISEKNVGDKVEKIIKGFPDIIRNFYKEEEINRGYSVIKKDGKREVVEVIKFHITVVTLRGKKDYNFSDITKTLFYLYKLVYNEPSLAIFEDGKRVYAFAKKKSIVFFSKSPFFLHCFKESLVDDGWDVEVTDKFKVKDEYKEKDFFLVDFDMDFAKELKEKFSEKRVLLLSHLSSEEKIIFEVLDTEKLSFSPNKLGVKTSSLIRILFKEVEL